MFTSLLSERWENTHSEIYPIALYTLLNNMIHGLTKLKQINENIYENTYFYGTYEYLTS